jgi:hypothetical protein
MSATACAALSIAAWVMAKSSSLRIKLGYVLPGDLKMPLAVMANQDTDVKKGARRFGITFKRKTSR